MDAGWNNIRPRKYIRHLALVYLVAFCCIFATAYPAYSEIADYDTTDSLNPETDESSALLEQTLSLPSEDSTNDNDLDSILEGSGEVGDDLEGDTSEESTASNDAEPLSAEAEQDETDSETLLADVEGATYVSTFAQLKAALQAAAPGGTLYIYLMQNITGEYGGIAIHASNTNVTIDGSPDSLGGSFVTYTDYNSETGSLGHVIRASATTNLTIKNLVIEGRNYYGSFSSANYQDPGSTITFDTVSYQGPQLVWNPYGRVILHNVNVEIAMTSSAEAQEVAEATYIELSGTVILRRTAAPSNGSGSSTYRGIFFTYDDAQTVVKAGAYVSIETTDFVYWNYTSTTSLTIEENAVLDINAANGFLSTESSWGYAGQAMQSITVGNGATLKITQRNATNAKRMLYVNGSLMVGQGATLDIRSEATNLYPIETSGNLNITFTNPERVILFSSNAFVMHKTGTSGNPVNLSIQTQAINIWRTTVPGDTIEDVPSYYWNRLHLEPFGVSATFTTNGMSGASINTPGFTTDDPADVFDATTFNVTNARALTLGAYELSIDPVYMGSENVTGTTISNADLTIRYTPENGAPTALSTDADAEGNYSVDLSYGLPLQNTIVNALSHDNYLNALTYTLVLPIRTTLVANPEEVVFKTESSEEPVTLQVKMENAFPVSNSTRIVGLEWFRISATDDTQYTESTFASAYENIADEDKGTDADMQADDLLNNSERTYSMPIGENGSYWVRAHYTDENGEDYYEIKSIVIDNIYTPTSGVYAGINEEDGSTLYEEPIPGTADSDTLLVGVALDLHSTSIVLNSTSDGSTVSTGTSAEVTVTAQDLSPLWILTSDSSQTINVDGTMLPTISFSYVPNPAIITVHFDAQGGFSEPIPDHYYSIDDTFEELPVMTLSSFDGWFTEPSGGVRVEDGDALPASWQEGDTVTLYAHWTPDITISNTVTGDFGDKSSPFTFTIYLQDAEGSPLPAGTQFTYTGGAIADSGASAPPDGVVTLDEEGKAVISLSHGQTITISGVLSSESIRILATEASLYSVSFIDSEEGTPTEAADTGVRSVLYADRTFDFTYSGDEIIVSGIAANHEEASTLLLIPLLIIGAGYAASRIRKYRKYKGA